MAYGGPTPQFQMHNPDLFSASDFFYEFDNQEIENSQRLYGATGDSTPMQRVKMGLEPDADDIPLHDFQLEAHRDPLIHAQTPKSEGYSYINTVKASQSMQSFQSISSDMTSVSVLSYNQHDSWINHPKVRENWRLVLGSAVLMVLGIILIFTGIGIALSPATGYHCIVIIVIGILCLIPGGYHFVYIYCAAIGRPGFHFNNLPALR